MSVMLFTEPFLFILSYETHLYSRTETDILKLPPTKNWRAMASGLGEGLSEKCV